MTIEEIEILREAILEECGVTRIFYVSKSIQILRSHGEIVIEYGSKQAVLAVDGLNVQVCCRPGRSLTFNVVKPDSIQEIARAVNYCMRRSSCDECNSLSRSTR